MEDCDDLNLIGCGFIKDGERETPNNCASQSSVNNRIEMWISNDARQCVVDPFHKLDVQICSLVCVPVAGFSKFGIGFEGEPNVHGRSARVYEFSFDLFPGSTLCGIGSRRLQPPIEFLFLSFG